MKDLELIEDVVEKITRIKHVALNIRMLPVWCVNQGLEILSLSLPEVSGDVFYINDLDALNLELDSYLKKAEEIFKEVESLNMDVCDMGVFFNAVPNYEATDFVLSFGSCMGKKLGKSPYVMAMYDFGDICISAPSSLEEAKKLTKALAPATLYEDMFDEDNNFIMKEIECF